MSLFLDGLNPLSGQQQILVDASISFSVLDNEYSVTQSSISIWVDDTLAYTDSGWVADFNGTVVVNGSGFDFTISSHGDLRHERAIEIAVQATNSNSETLRMAYSFNTVRNLYYNIYYRKPNGRSWVLSNANPLLHSEVGNSYTITGLSQGASYQVNVIPGQIQHGSFVPLISQSLAYSARGAGDLNAIYSHPQYLIQTSVQTEAVASPPAPSPPSPPAPPPAPVAPDPTVWLKLEEAGNPFSDEMGVSNFFNIEGTVTPQITGVHGYGVEVASGTANSLLTSSHPHVTKFSVAFWLYFFSDGGANSGVVLNFGHQDDKGIIFTANPPLGYMSIERMDGIGSNELRSDNTHYLGTDGWHFVGFAHSDADDLMKIWIDSSSYTWSSSGLSGALTYGNNTTRLGSWADVGHFRIDNYKFFSGKVLTDEEFDALKLIE